MRLHKIEIKNFRLLAKVELLLEQHSTVIVGRNNSGKTSLTELLRRLLSESPSFRLEDFSLSAHEDLWKAFRAKEEGQGEDKVREMLPTIEVKLTVFYAKDETNLGALGDCIIDLDTARDQVVFQILYQLKEGQIKAFFADLPKFDAGKPEAPQKTAFCRAIREKLPKLYSCSVRSIDLGDPTNTRDLEWSTLRGVLAAGFINAQRGLDDVTNRDRDILSKVIEALLKGAMSDSAPENDKIVAKGLQTAVQGIQDGIDVGFNTQLQALLPAFELFGYPGFADPALRTETTLDVEKLLTNHTRVHYAGINGINLPEAYNGLGARNLILILLRLLEFYKAYLIEKIAPCLQLIFIEEPEVHLHPQMQEVFIAQLGRIAEKFTQTIGGGRKWPVQFVVTTHSSHIANKAPFEAMRYFLVKGDGVGSNLRSTRIKDLRAGLDAAMPGLEFLHKYMTLTRCDLLFADKAALIEGASERLLLPKMIESLEKADPSHPKLSTQYLSIVEIGGAFAHLFFPLVDFLELPTLIITDLDATKKNTDNKYVACKVSEGEHTSNACLKEWFKPEEITPAALIAKADADKVDGILRIAYEVPEVAGAPCGRSFEDAFILANHALFGMAAPSEDEAWDKAKENRKSDFALQHAVYKTGWKVPRYIAEGLAWLGQPNYPNTQSAVAVANAVTLPQQPLQANARGDLKPRRRGSSKSMDTTQDMS